MQLEDYFDILSPDDIRIKGHRIGIDHVLEYFLQGYTPEEITATYPDLGLEKIYATITDYLHKNIGQKVGNFGGYFGFVQRHL